MREAFPDDRSGVDVRTDTYANDYDPNDEYQVPYRESRFSGSEIKNHLVTIMTRLKNITDDHWGKVFPELMNDIKSNNVEKVGSTFADMYDGKMIGDKTDLSDYDDLVDDPSWGARKGKEFEIINLRPMTYLQRTEHGFGTNNSRQEEMLQKEKIIDYARKMYNGEKFPLLTIDYSKDNFTQEGRHRAYAAYLMGASTVPVMLVKKVQQEVQAEEADSFFEAVMNFGISGKALRQETADIIRTMTDAAIQRADEVGEIRFSEQGDDFAKDAIQNRDVEGYLLGKGAAYAADFDTEIDEGVKREAKKLLNQVEDILDQAASDDNVSMISNLEKSDEKEIFAGVKESFDSGEMDWVVFYMAVLKLKREQKQVLPRGFNPDELD